MRAMLSATGACALVLLFGIGTARAQDQPEPTLRYVQTTSFEVPYEDRDDVISYLVEYLYPSIQLNPRVKNFRILNHYFGSSGANIILVSEFDTFADIDAECGAPCEEYEAQHEEPEEGDDGYEEHARKVALFNKYFSKHSDEIYTTNMDRAVVEGRMQGRVGPAPDGDM